MMGSASFVPVGDTAIRILARSCEAQSQLSVCFVERNCTFDVAGRIQDVNFTRAKACAVPRVIACLILLWEYRLDAGCFESFPAPRVWSYFDYRHWSPARIGIDGCQMERHC